MVGIEGVGESWRGWKESRVSNEVMEGGRAEDVVMEELGREWDSKRRWKVGRRCWRCHCCQYCC